MSLQVAISLALILSLMPVVISLYLTVKGIIKAVREHKKFNHLTVAYGFSVLNPLTSIIILTLSVGYVIAIKNFYNTGLVLEGWALLCFTVTIIATLLSFAVGEISQSKNLPGHVHNVLGALCALSGTVFLVLSILFIYIGVFVNVY